MKIDISAHIIPPGLRKVASLTAGGRIAFTQLPVLDSLEARFKVMAKYPDVVQILSVAHTLEGAGNPKVVYELARIANNEMAELVARYPDKFVGVAAIMPLLDMDSALRETDHAIKELGCKGIMISADATRPLDKPEFMALYEKMAGYDLPIWIHPMGDHRRPDYDGEKESKYRMWGLWGWPYQTTLAMTRLVFSGVFDRFPNIKFITHHAGAMVPFNSYRIHNWFDPAAERKEDFMVRLKKHPADYFRMFYNDTANAGNTAGLMCAHDFFGAGHLLFASDMPYGMPSGYGDTLYENTIKFVEKMNIPAKEKERVFAGNARSLFRIKQ
ncbi:MAG: amidohydrolase 2 [Dehalococcoidia bacterium]|nr:amidohydrolase 2 [Dehalococcoidia bacterium]